MFGRKKHEELKRSPEDIHLEEVSEELYKLKKLMQAKLKDIIMLRDCAEALPTGPDRDIELHSIQTAKAHLRDLIVVYDMTYHEWERIDKTKLVICTDWCTPKTAHEALHTAWEWMIREMYKV